VKHNIRLPGKKTNARRQIDVSVFEAGQSVPMLIAEAKRHGRPVDAVKAGSTIALVQDVGGVPAVMVSTSVFRWRLKITWPQRESSFSSHAD
jgi:hypothetical protein